MVQEDPQNKYKPLNKLHCIELILYNFYMGPAYKLSNDYLYFLIICDMRITISKIV